MRPITAHDVDLVTNKFYSYLDTDKEFADIMRILICEYTVCLVGGSIRDMVNQTTPRDFDLIVDIDNETLRSRFSKYISKFNSFGGLKCIIQNHTIDIWSFNDNWAFKTGLLSKNVENISRGAFYNIDALVLDLSHKEFYFEFYNHCVNTRILDFVSHDPHYLKSNPVPAQNVLKSYHIISKYNLNLSAEVHKYIEDWKSSTSDCMHDIIRAEIKHFGHEIYKPKEISLFLLNNLSDKDTVTPRKKRRTSRFIYFKTTRSRRKNA